MINQLDVFSLFEGMEWPATKQDLLQYATDNGFLDDVFEVINTITDEDYYFSSLNDFLETVGNNLEEEHHIEGDEDENNDEEEFPGDGLNEEFF